MINFKFRFSAPLLLVGLIATTESFAGFYGNFGYGWVNYSLKPTDTESALNYYGFAPAASFGYSIGRIVEFSLLGRYAPTKLKSAALSGNTTTFTNYGFETALRIASFFYIAARSLSETYTLKTQTLPEELPGSWNGTGAAIAFGAEIKLNKVNTATIAFDIGQASYSSKEYANLGKRTFNWVGLSFNLAMYHTREGETSGNVLRHWLGGH